MGGRLQFGRMLSRSVIDVLHVVAIVAGCRVSIVLAYLVVSVRFLFVMMAMWLGMWLTVCVMSAIATRHMRFTVAVMIRTV